MLAYSYNVKNNYNLEEIDINAAIDSEQGCITVDGKPTGIRLTQYPVFELEVRNQEQEKMGQHGIFDFYSFYGKRNIIFEGEIYAESHEQLVMIQNRVKRVFTLPSQPLKGINDGYVTIKWTDATGEEYFVNAKIQQDLNFSRSSGEKTSSRFYVSLKAESPYILTTEEYEATSLMGWRQGQMILPTFLPNNFNIVFNNLINIYQSGSADSLGKFRLYGPCTNPKITKLKEVFSYEELLSDFTFDWIGGEEDREFFQRNGLARKLISTNGAIETMEKTNTQDLSYLTNGEFINFYLYIDDIDKMDTTDNLIKFIETDGVDEFWADFSMGNKTLRTGWNYFSFLKDEFRRLGNPSWGDITKILISIKSTAGNTLEVTFDDLYQRTITYTERFLQIATTLSDLEYIDIDTMNGTVTKSGGEDLSGYLTLDSDWFQVEPKQNFFIYESDQSPLISWEYPTQQLLVKWRNSIL